MRTSGYRAAGLALAATAVVGVVQGVAQADDGGGVSIQVLLPSTTTINEPAVARYGTDVTLKGKVTSLTSGLGLGATDVQLTLDPVKGATKILTVRTDGAGNFVAHYTPKVKTRVHAVSAASLRFTTSFSRARIAIESGSLALRGGRCSADVRMLRSSSTSTGSVPEPSPAIQASSAGDRIWPNVSGAMGNQSSK